MTLLSPDELIELFNNEIETETIYTSNTSNIHALYAALIGKSITNAYVSKVGDILNIDTHYKASNSAVHSEEYGEIDLSDSFIMTDGLAADAVSAYNEGYSVLSNLNILVKNLESYGLFSSLNSSIVADNISIYTLEENSPVLYVNKSSLEITDSYIGASKSYIVKMDSGNEITIKRVRIWNSNPDAPVFLISGEEGANTLVLEKLAFENPGLMMSISESSGIEHISFTDCEFLNPLINSEEEIVYAHNLTNANVEYIFDNCTFTEGNLMNLVNSTVSIDASTTDISGNIIADDNSEFNITIGEKHKFIGSVNCKNAKVKLLAKAIWDLTEDTVVDELDLDYTSIIHKNGHSLFIDGEDYNEGVTIGSVVHYTTKAEKVYNREVLEKNCIVIKITSIGGGASEFILYDADDHLAYKALYSEFRDTGKTVDIAPILTEIENLLIDIDKYYSNTTIKTKDENTNALLVDGTIYNLDNIIVEKYNGAANEERGYLGENAAIRIINNGDLTLTNSNVVSDGWIAHGIYVDNSTLNMESTRLSMQDLNSIGVEATNNSTVIIKDCSITTNSEDSEALAVLLGANVSTENCNFIANGESFAAAITNGNINNNSTVYVDNGSTFESNDTFVIHLYATNETSLTATFGNSIINTSETNEVLDSLIKIGGGGIGNTVNLYLNGTILTNPPKSEAYIYVDPITANIYTDANTTFNQLNLVDGLHIKIEYGSIVNYYARENTFKDRFFVDVDSTLNLYLESSAFMGYFNREEEVGTVNVILTNGSTWILTGDDHVTSLTIDESSTINLNGYDLYINGKIYNPEVEVPNEFEEAKLTLGKVLKVLTSSEFNDIPISERQDDYIYFLYDRLEMWFKNSRFLSPFCIVDKMPSDHTVLVPNVLYITTYGKLFVYDNCDLKEVGHVEEIFVDDNGSEESSIEDPENPDEPTNPDDEDDTIVGADEDPEEDPDEPGNGDEPTDLENGEEEHKPQKVIMDPNQIKILKAAGTTYFYYAETRYIDTQTKTIVVPYQNGSYQLSVNIPEDLRIDEDTVIFYNTESGQWEIDGTIYSGHQDYPKYKGKLIPMNTSTIYTSIDDNNIIKSDLRVSPSETNMVNIAPNGLLVDSTKYVTKEQFSNLSTLVQQYIAISDKYIIELRDAVLKVAGTVTADTITEMIHDALMDYAPTIDDMINNYDGLRERLINIENSVDDTFNDGLEVAKQAMIDYINSINKAWSVFEEDNPKEYESQEVLQKRAAALDFARKELLEIVEDPNLIYFVEDSLPEYPSAGLIYATWDNEALVYRLSEYVYTGEDDAEGIPIYTWESYTPASTSEPPEDIATNYIVSNVLSIDNTNKTLTKKVEPIAGYTYVVDGGTKYYFNGFNFIELEE